MTKTQIFALALCLVVSMILSASSAPTSDTQSDPNCKTTKVSSSKSPDSVFEVILTVPNKTGEQPTAGTNKGTKPTISIDTKTQKTPSANTDKKVETMNQNQGKEKELSTQAMVQGSQPNPSPMKAEFNMMPFEYGGFEPSMQGGYGYGYNSMNGF